MTETLALPSNADAGCVLCQQPGGRPVWADDDWRVIAVDDTDFPAFYRVVSRAHVAEFTGLNRARRTRCMDLVCAVEGALTAMLQPTSINLASFGNVVPHLHWHVIARFDWDSHFPEPVWGVRQRLVSPAAADRLRCRISDLEAAVLRGLNELSQK